jgi:hypothetical protein
MATAARRDFQQFSSEFAQGMTAWENGLRTGQNGQWMAAVEDTLRRWRANVEAARNQTQSLEANDTGVADLERLVGEIVTERDELHRLSDKAATREEQADSLNPKERPSPYTNILGLQRIFRDSTRWTILLLSIFFGALALVVMGLVVWQLVVVSRPLAGNAGASMVGGRRS